MTHRFAVRVIGQVLFSMTYLSVPAAPQTAPPPACVSAEHRQFDFWLGDWEVLTPDGRVAGRNRIERVSGGCALLENWSGGRGMRGKSLNYWRPSDRQWHQVWVGGDGLVLELRGGLDQRAMVMSGEVADSTGALTRHRITWSPLADGRVRQRWESSADSGGTWSDAFVGLYSRVKSPAPAAKKR